jgi:hypothetical protein
MPEARAAASSRPSGNVLVELVEHRERDRGCQLAHLAVEPACADLPAGQREVHRAFDPFGELRRGEDRSAFARGEDLRRMEGEDLGVAGSADGNAGRRPASERGGAVDDQRDAGRRGHMLDGAEVAAEAERPHVHDRDAVVVPHRGCRCLA